MPVVQRTSTVSITKVLSILVDTISEATSYAFRVIVCMDSPACPVGFFKAVAGSSVCIFCAQPLFTSGTNSMRCDACRYTELTDPCYCKSIVVYMHP